MNTTCASADTSLDHPGQHPADARLAAVSDLKFVQANSLALLVQQEITKLIMSGEIGAGEWLNESALSQRFGVSRGPVREAFRSLTEIGLLRQEKNRGVFVRTVTADEADHIYELRELLDEFIARKVASSPTEAQLKSLREIHAEMTDTASREDASAYYLVNLRFHDQLAEYAGNPKLVEHYRRLMNELHIFRLRSLGRSHSLQRSLNEHEAIIHAIQSRDAEAAGRAAKSHARTSRERVSQLDPSDQPTK
jgi:phosphonate utilization transcriptional regulator